MNESPPILTGRIAPAPIIILETDYALPQPPINTTTSTWPRDLMNGKIFMDVGGAPWAWTQIMDVNSEMDDIVVGLSGTAINPDESSKDNPFAHPFGNDYEFLIAPDTRYGPLIAPGQQDEYARATQIAHDQFHSSVSGVIGMEMEKGLIPPEFQAHHGDRVCVFGRWIVDAGHADYHTEIHPPLLTVVGRAAPIAGDPDNPSASPVDATETTIIGRPYLVSQQFDDGALLEHLVKEIAKVASPIIPLSLRVEAHPRIFGIHDQQKKPFSGAHVLHYTVRPPTPRNSEQDEIIATFRFTVRSGVTVLLRRDLKGADSLTVFVFMNSDRYVAPPQPTRHDRNISITELSNLSTEAGNYYQAAIAASAALSANLAAPAILAQGILTDVYDPPKAQGPRDTDIHRMRMQDISSVTPQYVPQNTDDSQPFPIYGFLTLEWIREGQRDATREDLANKKGSIIM